MSVVCVYILSCINQSGLTSSLGQQPPSSSEPSAPEVLPLQPQPGYPNVVSAHPNHGGPDVVSLQPEPTTSNVVSPYPQPSTDALCKFISDLNYMQNTAPTHNQTLSTTLSILTSLT